MTEKIDLNKYKKSEIIEVIEWFGLGKFVFDRLEEVRDQERMVRACEDVWDAVEEKNKAMNEYFDWRKSATSTYGDSKNLPPEELEVGANLKRALEEAGKKLRIARKVVAAIDKKEEAKMKIHYNMDKFLGGER